MRITIEVEDGTTSVSSNTTLAAETTAVGEVIDGGPAALPATGDTGSGSANAQSPAHAAETIDGGPAGGLAISGEDQQPTVAGDVVDAGSAPDL
jgi:hypothetical protein